ncbi:hypothetical protein AB0L59_14350 [Streptomyces sp. NPDC052109]|uniref:hypothetical protein n=1 Tax=Streptomyces sp. NPDC052109 TaxID=3155527 RepID=UPI00342EA24B
MHDIATTETTSEATGEATAGTTAGPTAEPGTPLLTIRPMRHAVRSLGSTAPSSASAPAGRGTPPAGPGTPPHAWAFPQGSVLSLFVVPGLVEAPAWRRPALHRSIR